MAPQFSIALKNCDWPGAGDIIELGQRVGRSEIVVVVGQDLRLVVQRGCALAALPRLMTMPTSRPPAGLRDPVEVAAREEQQVGRHRRRRLEAHFLEPASRAALREAAGMLLTAICAGNARR